ncbi:response regulator [Patescibacteria group bacterium]|nr:response regulator [Patescibacteria group bacterium]
MSKNEIRILFGEQEKKPSEEQLKKKPKILVVEDEIEIADPLKELFEDDGWDVTTMRSGEGAIEELANNKFDVITCDVKLLGEKTGYDVINEIKGQIDRPAMLVVSSGIYRSQGVVFKKTEPDEAKITGIDYFVDKPFDLFQLQGAVKEAYEERLGRLNNGHK